MSTKVYRGFRFKNGNLPAIHKFLMDWRAELATLHKKAFCKVVIDIATEIHDQSYAYPGKHHDVTPFTRARQQVIERQSEVTKSGYRDPDIDFDFEVSVLPLGRRVYGMIFTERQEWFDTFLERPEVEDYAYWDSSDRPDHVTKQEWKRREKVWDLIDKQHPSGAPAMSGLYAQCTAKYMFASLPDYLAEMKPYEKRVHSIAKEAVLSHKLHEEYNKLSEEDRQNINPISSYMNVLDWLSTRDGQSSLAESTSHFRKILPETITEDMLLTKIHNPKPEPLALEATAQQPEHLITDQT